MARVRIKNNADNRQVAVYVRKSKITETGKSIEIQKEKCIALACVQFDVTEADVLIYEDEGKSGFYADRPQYKKMLKDIEGNKIKALICYKIDRISRRTIDLLNLVQQIDQKGIAFISVSDKELNTSSRTGKIMISLLSAIAEFERDIIAERITDNMYELAKEGRWLGGECPLGYCSKKERLLINGRKTVINHLEFADSEQITVKKLFEFFLQKCSYNATAACLNNEGLKTKKGKEFTATAVKSILQNPVYAVADADMQSYFSSFDVPIWADNNDFDGKSGIMAYNKTEQIKEIDEESRALDPRYTQRNLRRDIKDWVVSIGKHRGIISGAEWIRAQNIMVEICHNNSVRPKDASRSLLSGLISCAACGSRMLVRAESGRYNPDGSLRFRYVCNVKYRGKGGCVNSPNVKGYEADNLVIEQICNIDSRDSDLLKELLNTKNRLLLKAGESGDELDALKKRLYQIDLDIKSQISNLRTAPESVKQAIYTDITVLDAERNEKQGIIEAIQENIKAQDNQITEIEMAKNIILDFPRLIHLVSYEVKLQLTRRVVERVAVKDGTVHIFLKGSDADEF